MPTRAASAHLMLALFAFVALASCGQQSGDDLVIFKENQRWMDLIAKKDAAGVAMIYAEDGAMFPPNAEKVYGRPALKDAWNGFFKIPGMALTFKTDRLVFSEDHSIAVDIGTYELVSGDGTASQVEKGKSVVTWVRRDGKWLVLTDMFSSDAAPALAIAPQPVPSEPSIVSSTMATDDKALAIMASAQTLTWGPCPAIYPAGCEVTVLHGNPAVANADVFLRLPGKYVMPAHWHNSAERMTLVGGALSVKYQGQPETTLAPGTYAYGPAKLPHATTCLSDEPCTLFIAFDAPVDDFTFEGVLE